MFSFIWRVRIVAEDISPFLVGFSFYVSLQLLEARLKLKVHPSNLPICAPENIPVAVVLAGILALAAVLVDWLDAQDDVAHWLETVALVRQRVDNDEPPSVETTLEILRWWPIEADL